MATDDRRLLEVLRSLAPPDTSPDVRRVHSARAERPGEGSASRRVEAPHERGLEAPQEPGAPLAPRDSCGIERKGITLSAAETGVFFFAAVLLAVGAFLAGWYGRSLAGWNRPAPTPAGREQALPGFGAHREPASAGHATARPASLDVRTPTVSPARIARGKYTILVARFPSGSDAGSHLSVLREQGFETASLHPTTMGIELRVGSFASPGDPLARRWLASIRSLREAYRSAEITRLP